VISVVGAVYRAVMENLCMSELGCVSLGGLVEGRDFMAVFVFWKGCQKSRSGVWYGCHVGGY